MAHNVGNYNLVGYGPTAGNHPTLTGLNGTIAQYFALDAPSDLRLDYVCFYPSRVTIDGRAFALICDHAERTTLLRDVTAGRHRYEEETSAAQPNETVGGWFGLFHLTMSKLTCDTTDSNPSCNPESGEQPRITGVDFSGIGQNLHIVVHGSGFGRAPVPMPYTGDIPGTMFYFDDITHDWTGGDLSVGVTLRYVRWADSEIIIDGFSGGYGGNGGAWVDTPGDKMQIRVTNIDSGKTTTWEDTLPAGSSYARAVLADHPVAYWSLDDTTATTKDATGHGHDGHYIGNVRMGEPGPLGGENTAASFDGSSGYVSIPGTWGGPSWRAVTVEAWVYARVQTPQSAVEPTDYNFQAIVEPTDTSFVHFQLHPPCRVEDECGDVVYVDSGTRALLLPVISAILPPAWHYVVMTGRSGDSKVYVDGVERDSNSSTFTSITAANGLRIGSGFRGGRFFNGRIADVAIYNKALTANQVATHYKIAGYPSSAPSPSPTQPQLSAYDRAVLADRPFAYYHLGERSGRFAYDSSGHGHRATYGSATRLGVPGPIKGHGPTAAYIQPQVDSSSPSLVPSQDMIAAWRDETNVPVYPQGVTIEEWIKTPSKGTVAVSYAPYGRSRSQGDSLSIGTLAGKIVISAYDEDYIIPTSHPINDGQWHYLALTFDGLSANATHVYLDGDPLQTPNFTSVPMLYGLNSVTMSGCVSQSCLDGGALGEVAIYNDVLSGDRIVDHYRAAGYTVPVQTAPSYKHGDTKVVLHVLTQGGDGEVPEPPVLHAWNADASLDVAYKTDVCTRCGSSGNRYVIHILQTRIGIGIEGFSDLPYVNPLPQYTVRYSDELSGSVVEVRRICYAGGHVPNHLN